MKIAMIGHKRIPSREGGIEIVVSELSKRMVNLGNDVVAYNRKSEHIAGKEHETAIGLNTWEGVSLKWVPTPNSSKLNAIVYSFLSTLNAVFHKFDVIHFHAEGPASMVLLAKLFKKRSIVTIHGLDWQRSKWGGFATKFLKFGEKTAAKHADEIIVLSQNVKDYFLTTYDRETVFIPNGISPSEIIPAEIINEKYNLNKNEYILFLGRLVPEKGVHYLIEAYSKIITDKFLVIAGGSSHTSDYEAQLKEMAKSNPKIIFTGFVEGKELAELYSNAYIYCLPSDLEGMPISLLEAMSYGNCCLTSNISECTEVCENNAEYFEKNNIESLKSKLQYLLDNNNIVENYKSKAADYILNKYNWDKVTKQTLDLYSKSEI
ncbi:glycosyltransferase family 4 protein [uncultured Eubacterium sp.]|uniref:glycosyltransferase family 4 protein n=1 Tax=uncultured Eubacterium sp. TaxID=165185 RepID=UPI00261E25CD|nr:glycosyltransferase family 4 protein [uncultured Eubacterium sp.]